MEVRYWGVLCLLLVAALVVSWGLFSPSVRLPAWTHRHDKCWHFLAFLGISLLAYVAVKVAVPEWCLWIFWTAVGVVTELLQHFLVRGRFFSWGDVVANALGAALGLLLAASVLG